MKVRITPMIERDEEGRINLPVSNFHVVEDNVKREVTLNNLNDPFYSTLRDISKGSITPTTFESREFFEQSLKTRISDTIIRVMQEKYTLDSKLLEFTRVYIELLSNLKSMSKGIIEEGEFTKIEKDISSLNKKFSSKITELESYSKELSQYQNFVEENQNLNLFYTDLYKNDSSEVIRFGINTAIMDQNHSNMLASICSNPTDKKGSVKSGSSKNKKDDITTKTLHPLEVFLIQDAINSLNPDNTKFVLVDIFVRDDNGAIVIKNDNLDVHTIVLYRNNIGTISVIDPSNSEFSKHLSTNNVRIFRDGDERMEIATSSFIQKIYSPFDKDNVGPMPNQYRDCTDISVKIAFGLNTLAHDLEIRDIMSYNIIKEITNQKQCNENLFFTNEEVIARMRQASDDNVRTEINKILEFLDKQRASILAYPGINSETAAETIHTNNITIFNQEFSPSQYERAIGDVQLLLRENTRVFHEYVDSSVLSLLGENENDG